jgi:hypothetical protein
VARLSEINLGLYRTTTQPMIRSLTTEQGAESLRRLHPLRLGYTLLSDRNPAMQPLAAAAEKIKENRQSVSGGNPFLQWEKICSDWITFGLKAYGEWRDWFTEQAFFGIYGQPWLQALLGLRASNGPVGRHPGKDPDHEAFVRRRIDELKAKMAQGGPREAAIRALLYVRMPENAADERGFEMLRRIREEHGAEKPLAEFKQDLREQYFMLRIDQRRAIAAIQSMLAEREEEARQLLEVIRKVVTAGGPLQEEAEGRLLEVERMFTSQLPDEGAEAHS